MRGFQPRIFKTYACRILAILSMLGLAAVPNTLIGQDPVFSQFYSAPLQLNPALAGVAYAPNFAFNYRNQWPGINNAYQTYAASYDQFFRDINSGAGLSILADNAGGGILKTIKVSGIYAYKVDVSREWHARLGIEASWVQTRLDWNKLVFLDQIDEQFGSTSPGGTPYPTAEIQPENLNLSYLDIGTGAVLYNEKFYVGLSLGHLNTPDQSYLDVNSELRGGLPVRWTIHAGGEFQLGSGNIGGFRPFISPGAMLVKQGADLQVNIGTFIGLDSFYGGVWYRHANRNPDAVIASVGFRKDFLRITYSYDITVSRLSPNSGGSHEIGLIITLPDKHKGSIYDDCFSIFR